MASPLIRRLPREFAHNIGRYLGVFLLITISIGFVTGFLVAATSIERIIKDMPQAYEMEDGQFTCSFEAPKGAIEDVEDLGVRVFENFSKDADLAWGQASEDEAATDSADEEGGARQSGTVRAFANRTEVDLAAYVEGRAPESDNEIALDRVFCANNDLRLGDRVTAGGSEFELVGICTLPDYSSLFEDPGDFVFNALTFTVAQVTPGAFDAISGRVSYTYAYRANDDALTLAQQTSLSEDIAQALVENGASVENVMTADANQAISYADEDVVGDQLMWEVMMYLIIAIMAFVFVVITGANIEAESAIIGTLLASGYRKRELVLHYLALPALVGVAAAVVGNVLGYTLLSDPMRDLYYNSYSLPPYETYFNLRVLALTSIIPLVMLIGITLLGLLRKLRCSPLEFLRHETTRHSRRRGIALPERLPFSSRFRLRVFLCNLPSFLTLFCGIAFASLLLVFGLCLMPVFEHYASNLKSDLVAEHQYTLKAPVEVSDADAETYAVTTLETKRALSDSNESVTVYGIQPDSAYWTDIDVSDGRIVAGRGLTEKCAIAEGNLTEFTDPNADETYSFKAAGTAGSASNMNVYMDIDEFNRVFDHDEGYFNGYVSDGELDIDDLYLVSDLTPASMDKIVEQMSDSMESMTSLLVALTAIIYVVLMYLLTKTVIDRAARSISYLKVFGYRSSEINRLYIRSITAAVAGSLVASLPVTITFLTLLVRVVFMEYSGNFEVVVPPERLALEVCLGLACYAIVAVLHVSHIKRVPLAEALKAQE